MKDIEIKIWANPQGFTELTMNMSSCIFTKKEKDFFNPDSYDSLAINEYYSIFYAKESYVVNYHFLWKTEINPKLDFRGSRQIISVAIPRGYKFGNLTDSASTSQQTGIWHIIKDLKRNYENFLREIKDINILPGAVSRKVGDWISHYSQMLTEDDMQPVINLPGKANLRGYVFYKSDEELQQFLEVPVRSGFKGAYIMFFLPYSQNGYGNILNLFTYFDEPPKFTRTFAVYFPSYQDAPIANIISLDEMLDFLFEKQYCEPIHLTGKYSEHMSDWKITPTDDRTGYRIGLQFQEKECRYKLNVKFIDLKGDEQKALSVNNWLFPSSGMILWEDNDYWLVLKGSENEQLSHIEFRSDRDNYRVGKWTLSGNVINITIDEVFLFKVAELKKYIYDKYKFTPEIFLSVKNQWSACNDDRISLKGTPKDYRIRISESPDYQEAEFLMEDANMTNIRLIKKPDISFNFRFKGAIQEWLEASDRRYLILSEVRSDSDIPEFKLNLSRNILKMPVSSITKKFCLKAFGFKDKCIILNEKNTDIEIEMQLVWWKKLLGCRLLYLFVGLLLGYIAGCLWHPVFSDKVIVPENEPEEGGIEKLKPVESDDSTYSTPASYYNDSLQNEGDFSTVDDKSSEPSTPVITPAPVAVEKQMSPELTKLMEKLKGIEYTNGDIAKAKVQAGKEGFLKKNSKFFEEVQFALNVVVVSNKRNAAWVKGKLSKCTELSSEQKSAIGKIVEDELVYNSDTSGFNTIKDMYENYK